jgi:hypothetical protein
VHRKAWDEGKYLALMPHMLYVWQVTKMPNPAAGNWLPLLEDLLADDWAWLETIKTEKQPVIEEVQEAA